MHATARHLNVVRRLNAWAAALAIAGAPRVILLADTVSKVGPDATVRLHLTPMTSDYAGRYSSTAAAFQTEALLTADVFWPTGEATQPANLYDVIAAADDIKNAGSRLALAMLDYSSDPANPTTIDGAWLRCLGMPEVRDFPRADGFTRRQVLIPLVWHSADNDS